MNHFEDSVSHENQQLHEAVERLASNKQRWALMDPVGRLACLHQILVRLENLDHEGWGTVATSEYGYDPGHPEGDRQSALESMINASICIGTVRHLIRTVSSQVNNQGPPILKREVRGEREVLHVFPVDYADRCSPEGVVGCTGEVWLQPKYLDTIEVTEQPGSVCLVLGAGNQSFLSFCDVMYHLFVENSVCLMKHHPLRSFCGPFFEEAFADLIGDGFFFACDAGLEESQFLVHHSLVDCVHMTGGVATHDAIVWGKTAEERSRNKDRNTPVLNKPMFSELGCVTPWIIAPGTEWSAAEIQHMAGHLVAAFVAQNSCNCLSPKLLVLDADWPQYQQFCEAVRTLLQQTPHPPIHYPNTIERYDGFVAAYDASKMEQIHGPRHPGMVGEGTQDTLPWLLIHLDENSPTYALENEAFAPVLAIYTLSAGNNTGAFLAEAVSFVNDSVWGSLSCTLIVHPNVEDGPSSPVEQAITNLRYGSVGVNVWTASVYGMSGMTWGAYPGEELSNVASGRGVVRNSYALRGVEKSVLRSPFWSKTQMVVGPRGDIGISAAQLRAVRRLVVRPGVRSLIKLICQMMSPVQSIDGVSTVKQRCLIFFFSKVQELVRWTERD